MFEVYFPVSQQSGFWSVGFLVYAVVLAVAAFSFSKIKGKARPSEPSNSPETKGTGSSAPSWSRRFIWVGFSACGSILLLAITKKLCEDTAVIPFLWIAPLALYLVTFIIAFDHSRWYSRPIAITGSVLVIGFMLMVLNTHPSEAEQWSIPQQITVLCVALFFSCLVCHGEIVRLKPSPKFLTGFYLLISIGGALGGLFVNLVAPQLFDEDWDLHLGLVLLAVLVSIQLCQCLLKKRNGTTVISLNQKNVLLGAAWVVALALGLLKNISQSRGLTIATSRGFFGTLKVTENTLSETEKFRSLFHGKTIHGLQFQSEERRNLPTAYFHPHSGVGTTFGLLRKSKTEGGQNINVGVLGLGIGTLAAYAREGDHFRFYEINPQVTAFAKSHFSYLDDCRGDYEVVPGDGRISFERELAAMDQAPFDLLVIDAFSGHAPPIHLLTREAFEVYLARLTDDGVLALNISNLEIDFSDPIRNQAIHFGWSSRQVVHLPKGGIPSIWVLVTRNGDFLERLGDTGRITGWSRATPKPINWTDDFHNLLQALR